MNAQIVDARDSSDAERFLHALGGGGHHFRTIPEAPTAKGSARKYKAFDRKAIKRDNGAGSGVFVVVNEGGNTDASISAIRAAFLDIDRKSFASDDACERAIRYAYEGRTDKDDPIAEDWPRASMVVRSGGGGAHLYWLVDDCPVERFKPVQQALAGRFNGDPAVCNLSRILRLPGTIHWKSGAPMPVRLPLCKPERRYRLDDLLRRFGIALDPTAPPEPGAIASINGRPCTPDTVAAMRDALARLDKRDPDAVHARATWLRVLLAIRAHDWGETGRTIAEEWSAQSAKYDKDRFAGDWRSLKPDGAVSPSTLYWLAGPDLQRDCPDAASDDGMACRFAEWLGGSVMHARGQFHVWVGSHWKAGETATKKLLKDFAAENSRQANENFLGNPKSSATKFLDKVAKSLLYDAKQGAVLRSLRVLLTVPDDQLDRDPMLLAVPNGMVDLRTGKLTAADPSAYCTRCAGVPYDTTMDPRLWLEFLRTIFANDNEKIAFLRRWMGYCLTGSMAEEKLFFGYGQGGNGKTVIANAQLHTMGNYAVTGDPSWLMASRRDSGSASPELMTLIGARLCLLNESKAGDRLDDGTIKKLVSTEQMIARPLYGNPVAFFPSAKLYLRSNHRPTIRDETTGMWRRLMLVPFSVEIPPGQDIKNYFENVLKPESPAILAWAIQGCLEWQRSGLRPPKTVTEATDSYRTDLDAIREWLDVRTEGGGETPTATLLDDYARFAGLLHLPTARAFAGMLKDRGVEKHRTSKSRGYKVTLKPVPSTSADDLC